MHKYKYGEVVCQAVRLVGKLSSTKHHLHSRPVLVFHYVADAVPAELLRVIQPLPCAARRIILARATIKYGNVYLLARRSSSLRSCLVRTILYGFFRGKLAPSQSEHSREGPKTVNNTLSYLLKGALSPDNSDYHTSASAQVQRRGSGRCPLEAY